MTDDGIDPDQAMESLRRALSFDLSTPYRVEFFDEVAGRWDVSASVMTWTDAVTERDMILGLGVPSELLRIIVRDDRRPGSTA